MTPRSSFTLIELLLSVGIIGILASVVIAAINPRVQLTTATDASRTSAAKQLERALLQYLIDTSQYPSSSIIPQGEANKLPLCSQTATSTGSCIDSKPLVPTYIAAIPRDTLEPNPNFSGYSVYKDGSFLKVVPLYLDKTQAAYVSQYPPVQNDTYVKATSSYSGYPPYLATDSTRSLTGTWGSNSWMASIPVVTNQRMHIDLGSAKVITRIYYENGHYNGDWSTAGAKNFTFWGSNTAGISNVTWKSDADMIAEGWTQLATSQSTFDRHAVSNQADPKYITVANAVGYRYYAFKFADNWGAANYLNIRRIELQAVVAN